MHGNQYLEPKSGDGPFFLTDPFCQPGPQTITPTLFFVISYLMRPCKTMGNKPRPFVKVVAFKGQMGLSYCQPLCCCSPPLFYYIITLVIFPLLPTPYRSARNTRWGEHKIDGTPPYSPNAWAELAQILGGSPLGGYFQGHRGDFWISS